MTIHIDRDSVAVGDDVDSHATTIKIMEDTSLVALIKEAKKACPLASIYGGKATWIIYAGDDSKRLCIGVTAQQWKKDRFLISDTVTAEVIFDGIPKKLKFYYWLQNDPDYVFESLKKGNVPNKY